MARSSLFLTLLVAAMAIMCSTAFAPAPALNLNRAAVSTALPVKVKVEVGDGEPIESALRRFKREINKSGHLMELRHKRYFENPQQRKIRKVKEARLRIKFERMNKRRMSKRT